MKNQNNNLPTTSHVAPAIRNSYVCIVTTDDTNVVYLANGADKAEASSAYNNYVVQAAYDDIKSSGYQRDLIDGSVCLQLFAPDGSLLSQRFFDNSSEPTERDANGYCCNYSRMADYQSSPIASNRSEQEAMAAFNQVIATSTANGIPNNSSASQLARPTHVLRVFGRANQVLATHYFDESETQETSFPRAYATYLLAKIGELYPENVDATQAKHEQMLRDGASGTRANGMLVDILVANGCSAVELLKTFQQTVISPKTEDSTPTTSASTSAPKQLTPGCYFDSAYGFACNGQRVIALAKQYGWVDQQEVLDENGDADSDDEFFTETVNDATDYLANLAPEGHYADWVDGDYGVWAVTYKENQFRYVINLDERGEFSADFYRIDVETGQDEQTAFHHVDTSDAESLGEDGVDVRDGEAVMNYFVSLSGDRDYFGTGSNRFTILEDGEDAVEQDRY